MTTIQAPRVDATPAAAQAPSRVPLRQRVAEVVFPVASTHELNRRTVLGYVVGLTLAAAYPWATPGGRSHLTHMWAEDGAVFLINAKTLAFPAVILQPYAGYLHSVPRLAAELVALLPFSWAAAGMAIAAVMLRAALAVLVFAAARGHCPSPWLRLAIAATIVVLPVGNNEALGNLTNVHWFVLFAAFWVLLWRPASGWAITLASVVLLLAATSSPLVFALVPLAALRLALPLRRDRLPAAAYLFGTAVQLVPVVTNHRTPGDPFDLAQATYAAIARGPLVMLLGPERTADLYPKAAALSAIYGWPALLATLLVLAAASVAIVNGSAPRQFLVAALLAYAALIMAAIMYLNWGDILRIDHDRTVITGQRYGIVPCLFLFAAVACGLDRLPRPSWRVGMWAARTALAAVIVYGAVFQWGSGEYGVQLYGPSWTESVASARAQCVAGGQEVKVQENPDGWVIPIRCDQIGWEADAPSGMRPKRPGPPDHA